MLFIKFKFYILLPILFLFCKTIFKNKLIEKDKIVNDIKKQLNYVIKEKNELQYKIQIQNNTLQSQIFSLQNINNKYEREIETIIKNYKEELKEKEETINALQKIVTNISGKNDEKTKMNNMIDLINNIKNTLKNDEYIENEMMKKHTTFRIGGPAKVFVKPKNVNQIIEIINLCNKHNVSYFILGNGSNLLVSDSGYMGVVIQIHQYNFSNLEVIKNDENNYILRVGAGMLMRNLSIEASLLSLEGLEDIIDIPGTVGGGISMNASFLGTGLIKPLRKVKIITPEGVLIELTKEECGFYHRGSILRDKKYLVIEATFELKKGNKIKIQKTMTTNTEKRYKKQPMYFRSAGCFFLWNYKKNGSMYEKYKKSNLIGYKVGNAMVYTHNIAFVVNLGNSNAKEIMRVVVHIENVIKKDYNIDIKREVVIIGNINLND